MSKDKAVCAKIKPYTVSVSDPVKLFPTRRIDEFLRVLLEPCLEDSRPDLGVTSLPRI